ncbi:MAG: SDR family oxidoreductase [Anaerolineales bacterium]|nr:MAG: SDR family oxidoreductase [Anaerolineales bacterium]
MEQLMGKVAIITGSGSGIGRGIAKELAKHGTRVIVCGRRKEKIDETVEQIWSGGGGAIAVEADVSQPVDVDHVIKTTLESYEKVDILINNAGVSGGGSIHNHDAAVWNRVLDVNLGGAFLMTRAVLPHMRTQGSGHIINISSESGLEYYQGNGAYGVSKHALNALGEYVQRENQDFNIRVNTICPGMVVSEMTIDTPGLDHEKCLYPEDIADLVLWLLTRRPNIKIGTPILIQTMQNPWE